MTAHTGAPGTDRGTVVVTGAAGRLGAAIVAALRTAGRTVVGVDRLPPARDQSELDWVQGDLTTPGLLAGVVDDADAVVHTAGFPFPTMAEPHEIFRVNTQSTFAVLDACAEARVPRVVLSSSGSVLGLRWAPPEHEPHPAYLPVDEDYPVAPTDCYALSKQVDEASAAMFARRSGASVVALRFPGIAGPAELAGRASAVRRDPAVGRRTLWAYLDLRDAAAAFVAATGAQVLGCEVIGVAAADTLSELPTRELVDRFHPGTEVRHDLEGCATTWDLAKAARVLGWRPRHSWRDQAEPAGSVPEQQ